MERLASFPKVTMKNAPKALFPVLVSLVVLPGGTGSHARGSEVGSRAGTTCSGGASQGCDPAVRLRSRAEPIYFMISVDAT